MHKKLLGVLVGAFWIASAMAQTTGTISGVVRDATGGVVPGASVAVRNVETGITRTLPTDAQGRYQAANLSVGQYEVEISLSGFRTELRSGIGLTVAQEAVVNFTMQVGQVAERVEVTGEAPLVEATNATITGLVDQNTIRDLPLNGRSFTEMLTLQVGTVLARQDGGARVGGGGALGGGAKVSVSGARPGQNSYLLDGTDMNDSRPSAPGGSSGITLGVDAVREFRVLTNSFSAEYGRAAGGVLTAVTKSGTNDLHGSVFEFLRNDKLDANYWESAARSNGQKPAFKRNQFGFSLGGPVKQNKTFFFGAYEALRDRQGQSQSINVPTAAAKSGCMPLNGTVRAEVVCIGDSRFPLASAATLAAAKPWLDLYPLPNGIDNLNGTGKYNYVSSQPTDQDYFSGRLDHSFSTNHSIFARYTRDRSDLLDPSTPLPLRKNYFSRNNYLTVQFDSILTASTLNTARFGMNRSHAREALDVDASRFDLNAMSFVPGKPFDLGGNLSITGLPGIGNANGRGPIGTNYRLFEGSDDVTLIRGSHTLKTGFNFKKFMSFEETWARTAGVFSFNDGLWQFLQGASTQFQVSWANASENRDWDQKFFGAYLQDDFRLKSNLTLNLGVRLEFLTSPVEAEGRCANLTDVMDSTPNVGCPFFETFKNNWAPRVGFAWDTKSNSKLVVRGGFGLFHEQPFPAYWRAGGRFVPPFTFWVPIAPAPFAKADTFLDFSAPPPSGNTEIRNANYTGTTYMMQYNFNIQSEIRQGTGVMLGYIGSVGRKLFITRQTQTLPRDVVNGQTHFVPLPVSANAPATQLTPFLLNPTWSSFLAGTTEGSSSYDAMVFTLSQRFRGGLRSQVSYTFGKTMSISDTVYGSDLTGGDGSTGTMDGYDIGRDWGVATYSLKHNLSVNYTYQLPFRGQGTAGKLIGGWELSGIVSRQSGVPFSVTTAFLPDHANSPIRHGNRRPDLVGATNNPVEGTSTGCTAALGSSAPANRQLGTPDLYFDPCAFANPARGFYGNLGRDTLTGPGLVNFNISLVKNTPVTERINLQFRAEFFNIANHPNFSSPSSGVFDSRARLSTSMTDNQQISSTTTDPRRIQFGLKLLF